MPLAKGLIDELKGKVKWEIVKIAYKGRKPAKKIRDKNEDLLYERMKNRFAQIAFQTRFLIDLGDYTAKCNSYEGSKGIFLVLVTIEKKVWSVLKDESSISVD